MRAIAPRCEHAMTDSAVDTRRLTQLVEDALLAVGYDLVDLEYRREPHGWVLRVYIDHPADDAASAAADDAPGAGRPVGSAITHQDCEAASRHLSAVLDVDDPIDTRYHLEVSSPGVRRPLRRERDFVRFSGQRVRIQLEGPLQGRRRFVGRLHGAAGGVVTVDVDGERFDLPMERIQKARLEVEL